MGKPNVGDQIALQSGPSGKVWGVRETADGVSVQFGPEGEWHAVDAEVAAVEEPTPVAPEPAPEAPAAEPAAEVEPVANVDEAPAAPVGKK